MNDNRKHINSAQTKKTLLALSEALRNGKFTRVSDQLLDRVADRFYNILREEVQNHPTVGKTLM